MKIIFILYVLLYLVFTKKTNCGKTINVMKKLLADQKNRPSEYYEQNIACIMMIVYSIEYIYSYELDQNLQTSYGKSTYPDPETNYT